ncbi:hypothetical protein DB459_01435 [Bradyrhizobium sp. WD16]|nr:hypothetical protein DB459_01435 [Bradyrhizobium sp. WD16]
MQQPVAAATRLPMAFAFLLAVFVAAVFLRVVFLTGDFLAAAFLRDVFLRDRFLGDLFLGAAFVLRAAFLAFDGFLIAVALLSLADLKSCQPELQYLSLWK